MQLAQIKTQWERDGYVIIPSFLNMEEIAVLREICDHILRQVLKEKEKNGNFKDITNIAYLTNYQYFQNDLPSLLQLLEFIANPRIISILKFISDAMPLFHNTQYFYNPLHCSWEGNWHRDTQFLAPDIELEKIRMRQFTGVHFRVAFLEDSCLEYVPGSEQRWDTEAEFYIRKGEKPNQSKMPNSKRITLKPGDACLFHAWGIHRGTYQVDKPRRTLDIIYQWEGICDYYPPPPMCFHNLSILNHLSDEAKECFNYFINTYKEYWEESK